MGTRRAAEGLIDGEPGAEDARRRPAGDTPACARGRPRTMRQRRRPTAQSGDAGSAARRRRPARGGARRRAATGAASRRCWRTRRAAGRARDSPPRRATRRRRRPSGDSVVSAMPVDELEHRQLEHVERDVASEHRIDAAERDGVQRVQPRGPGRRGVETDQDRGDERGSVDERAQPAGVDGDDARAVRRRDRELAPAKQAKREAEVEPENDEAPRRRPPCRSSPARRAT